jgi:hypothetical protein
MAKNRDDRYQTAKDMLIDLRSLKRQLDLKAEIDRTSSPDVERVAPADVSGKKRVLLIALAAMVLATAAIFAVSMWRSRQQRTSASVVTPSSAPVAEERTLTYWITVQKFRNGKAFDNPFPVAGEINFEADYRIRVHVRSPQPGYLYIFNEGPTSTSAPPEFVVVFPSPTANQSSSYLNAGQVVQIPEKSWLKFDEQQGVEKLWLVFSEEAIPELKAVKQFANPQTKMLITDVAQNKIVQSFLTNPSLPKPGAEKGETLTTVKAAGKLLVYAIKLEHH